MNGVDLISLGGADEVLLDDLAGFLSSTLRVDVRKGSLPLALDSCYDPARCQYNSTAILVGLKKSDRGQSADGKRLLAVTPHDLFIPILTFVFGEAELRGNVAVVSYHRFQNERYGLPPNREVLRLRLYKEALHELGHACGLIHCPDNQCVMYSSPDVEGIDGKRSRFCRECALEMA